MDIAEAITRKWWVLALFGLVSVLFGLMAVFSPLGTAVAMAWVIGVMAIAEGVIAIVALFGKDYAAPKWMVALYALLSLVFGVLAVLNPVATAAVLLIFLAAWLLVAGVFRLILAVRIRKQVTGEWLIALSGMLAIVLAGFFMLFPAAGLVTVALWIGLIALIYGVVQIWAGFKLRAWGRRRL